MWWDNIKKKVVLYLLNTMPWDVWDRAGWYSRKSLDLYSTGTSLVSRLGYRLSRSSFSGFPRPSQKLSGQYVKLCNANSHVFAESLFSFDQSFNAACSELLAPSLNITNYADDCVCILVAARSKAWICGLLLAGIAGSNTTWDMDVSIVCRQVKDSATGWSLTQRIPTECVCVSLNVIRCNKTLYIYNE
jgi:hypothetical protein